MKRILFSAVIIMFFAACGGDDGLTPTPQKPPTQEETPEVKEVARLLDITTRRVVEIMDVYRFCDPYLNHADLMISPLLLPCQNVWDRYGNADTKKLSTLAKELHHYFK